MTLLAHRQLRSSATIKVKVQATVSGADGEDSIKPELHDDRNSLAVPTTEAEAQGAFKESNVENIRAPSAFRSRGSVESRHILTRAMENLLTVFICITQQVWTG